MNPLSALSRYLHAARRRVDQVASRFGTGSSATIPTKTRFFRNQALMTEVFGLLRTASLPAPSLFFHACSSGEEPYSAVMFNLETDQLPITVAAADYNPAAVASAQRGVYPRHVIDVSNRGLIGPQYRRYFEPHGLSYRLAPPVRSAVSTWQVLDYTDAGSGFERSAAADVVFCNSSLLYHPATVQAQVLDRLCRQAGQALVVTGADNAALETVLPQHGFAPHKRHWQAIYDGCPLRRIGADRPHTTPTTPYLSDRNRAIEHYFRYAIFLRAGSAMARAALLSD